MYLILFLVIVDSTLQTIESLKLIIANRPDPIIMPSLQLKVAMLRRYLYLVFFYFSYELLFNGLLPTFQALIDFSSVERDTLDPYSGLKQHLIELTVLLLLLFGICRSRRWPLWFTAIGIIVFDE